MTSGLQKFSELPYERPNLDKLEAAMAQSMQSPAIRQRMESVGFVVPSPGARHYAEFVKEEIERWTKVIKHAGIKTE